MIEIGWCVLFRELQFIRTPVLRDFIVISKCTIRIFNWSSGSVEPGPYPHKLPQPEMRYPAALSLPQFTLRHRHFHPMITYFSVIILQLTCTYETKCFELKVFLILQVSIPAKLVQLCVKFSKDTFEGSVLSLPNLLTKSRKCSCNIVIQPESRPILLCYLCL